MNKFTFCFLGLLLAAPPVSFADSDGVCTNLSKYTCAVGKYDDGTAVAENQSSFSNPVSAAVEKVRASGIAKFSNAFKDPANTYFRKMALSATGLSMNQECQGAEDSPSDACVKLMAQGASLIFEKKNSSNAFQLTSNGNLSDEMLLIQSDQFKSVESEMQKELRSQLKTDDVDKKLRGMFPKIQSLLIAKVDSLVQDPKIKKQMIDKIKAVKYKGTECNQTKMGVPGSLLDNSFFSPDENGTYICGGMSINNASDFHLAFVLAHELSHSIDPCNIAVGPTDFVFHYNAKSKAEAETQYPLQGLIQCLRGGDSAKAEYMVGPPYGYAGYAAPPPGQATPYPQPPPAPEFCQNDQVIEAVADWFAGEVTPGFIQSENLSRDKPLTQQQVRNGYSNVFRGLCNEGLPPGQFAGHPSVERRVDYELLTQPDVRNQMGCPPVADGRKHCQPGPPGAPQPITPVLTDILPARSTK